VAHLEFHDAIDARPASRLDAGAVEPSHIHIPRPSRLRQSSATHAEHEPPEPPQLELVQEEAA